MSRTTVFSSPLLLGFEQFERTLERIAKASTEGYPPYNVEQIGEDRLCLTLAVAGFSPAELDVSIEEDQLIVRGKQRDDAEEGRVFLHRGIAARQFQRRFVLAERIEVAGARLESGLLHIDLKRPRPSTRIRQVRITEGPAPRAAGNPGGRGVEAADIRILRKD